MDKNWLIRTKSKQILGPVSKSKIIELIQKGSIKGEDEIASGNGYWFQIKEKDLVDKYIYSEEIQSFNPISEAPDVLTKEKPASVTNEDGDEVTLPDNADLEYPDMDGGSESAVDNTVAFKLPTGGLISNDGPETNPDFEGKAPKGDDLDYPDTGDMQNIDSLADEDEIEVPSSDDLEYPDLAESPTIEAPEEEVLPAEDDLAYPDMGEPEEIGELAAKAPVSIPDDEPSDFEEEIEEEPVAKKKKKKAKKKKAKKKKKVSKTMEKTSGNDRYLFIILFLLFSVMAGLFFYYKKIINKPLPFIGLIVSDAEAQSTLQFPKKKS